MYLINYVNVVVCGQVGSSPPSVFRGVRFTSCPVDKLFSWNLWSVPTVFLRQFHCLMCSLRHNHTHLSIHHSLITLSLHNVKSEILKLSLNKPCILLTVRCVPYWQGFSTIRSVCYRRFQAPSASEHWLLLRNRRRQVAKSVIFVPDLIIQIIMNLQLSVSDTILEIRQDSTPSIFL